YDKFGNLIIVWGSDEGAPDGKDIKFRKYGFAGGDSGEQPLAVSTAGDQFQPKIGCDVDGNVVISWTGQDGSGNGVFARGFSNDLVPLGPEIPVNTTTAKNQGVYAFLVNADGSFDVVWYSDSQDGDSGSVYLREFNAAGNPISSEI